MAGGREEEIRGRTYGTREKEKDGKEEEEIGSNIREGLY